MSPAAARTRQLWFVGCRRGLRERAELGWVNACGNQARHVRHVDKQVCADAVSDFTHFAQSPTPE